MIVVLYQYDNVAAVEYSVDWPVGDSWYFTSFTSCANLLLGDGSGPPLHVAQAWSTPLVAATDSSGSGIALLRLWSDVAGQICLREYLDSGVIRMVDSTGVADTVWTLQCSGVGDSLGTDPCSP